MHKIHLLFVNLINYISLRIDITKFFLIINCLLILKKKGRHTLLRLWMIATCYQLIILHLAYYASMSQAGIPFKVLQRSSPISPVALGGEEALRPGYIELQCDFESHTSACGR